MALLLGIDGGGTKTSFVLADEKGIVARATGGGTNLNCSSRGQVGDILQSAIAELCAKANVTERDIAFACFGAAGASHSEIRQTLEEVLREIISARTEIATDVEIALEAAFHGGPGIIVLAGTGSIAYGRNPIGEVARAGGWGRAVSDEGSGYWIGRYAVSAVLRALDAEQRTALVDQVFDVWHAGNREELAALCNGHPLPEFSELFPAVLRAANAGDIAADELLAAAAIQLAELARVVLRRLWPEGEPVAVAVDGGVFRNSQRIFQIFEHFVRAERLHATVNLSPAEPVIGALFRARKLSENAR